MAISNFFVFFFFLLQVSLNTRHTFKVQKTDLKLEKKKKKVQIILQTSGESIKEDMALLARCGSENRNVRSEAFDFCSLACPDLPIKFGRERVS